MSPRRHDSWIVSVSADGVDHRNRGCGTQPHPHLFSEVLQKQPDLGVLCLLILLCSPTRTARHSARGCARPWQQPDVRTASKQQPALGTTTYKRHVASNRVQRCTSLQGGSRRIPWTYGGLNMCGARTRSCSEKTSGNRGTTDLLVPQIRPAAPPPVGASQTSSRLCLP
jgi:hypothetical protein